MKKFFLLLFIPSLLFCKTNIYYNLGIDSYFKNNLEDSLSNFKKATSAFPESFLSWFYLGKTYYRLKMNKEAKDALLKASSLSLEDVKSRLLLAQILMEEEDYKNAAKSYKDVLSIEEENLEANFSLGKTYIKLEKFDDAIFYLKKAAELAPDEPEVHFSLGCALLSKDEPNFAKDAFTKAISLESNNPLFYYYRGNAYFKLADYTNPIDSDFVSVEDYRRAIEFGLYTPDVFFMYGNALLARGFYYLKTKNEKKAYDMLEKAIVEYKHAISLSEGASNAYNNMGLAYYYLDRTDEAIFYFKKSVELEPLIAFFHDNLGDAYYKKGDFKNSLLEFSLALELSPDYTPDDKILPFPARGIKEKIREAKRRVQK
ncbi:MAG: tetratricopeptide repeat protein [bacterium]